MEYSTFFAPPTFTNREEKQKKYGIFSFFYFEKEKTGITGLFFEHFFELR